MKVYESISSTISGRVWQVAVLLFISLTLLGTSLHVLSVHAFRQFWFISITVAGIDAILVSLISISLMSLIYFLFTRFVSLPIEFKKIWRITLISTLPSIIVGGIFKVQILGLILMSIYVVLAFKSVVPNCAISRATIAGGLPVVITIAFIIATGHYPHWG